MKNKYTINFQEVEFSITEPITKFGGQPVWIEKPEWAVSRSTGKPMMFICQITLDEEIFGQTESKMAYLFINNEDEDAYTSEPDSGENAVIIQPNGNNPSSIVIEDGPSLLVWKEVEGEKRRKPFNCEFAVEKSVVIIDDEKMFNDRFNDNEATPSMTGFKEVKKIIRSDDLSTIGAVFTEHQSYLITEPTGNDEESFQNKVGGIPNFLQSEEFPDENKENWNLLLQLDSGHIPFDLDFGDIGIGYAFVSKDGKTGKFLWQCS